VDTERKVLKIPVEDIIPNRFQPRLAFDDEGLEDLSNSIQNHGIIQPLVLRQKEGKYEIVAGERRYRAALKAGLTSVPGIITSLSDRSSAEVAIIENTHRKDLSSIEEARGYQALLDKEGISQEELAKKMGLSQSAISNKLRLLTLSMEVQTAILGEKISERHARSLLKITDLKEQVLMLNKTIENRLTVKQLEDEIKRTFNQETPKIKESFDINKIKEEAQDLDIMPIEKEIRHKEIPVQKETMPNTFFNFLETEAANLETEELIDNIELLDFFVPTEENKTFKEIRKDLEKYKNIRILEHEDQGIRKLEITLNEEEKGT
jgi:ParB family chromosome partitioning protein